MNKETAVCLYETLKHIRRVQEVLSTFATELLVRGNKHDTSKLEEPELSLFSENTAKLQKLQYGSAEYQESLAALGPALAHHYARNRHHPEHHKNGINDMTLQDLIEMFCDWKAASERHNNGNILKSIEINGERFKMSEQLIKIFENTAREMF
jgi:hypothetical protein